MDYFSMDRLKFWADQYLVPFAIDLVIAILVFVIGRWVARAITKALGRLMARAKFDESLTKFLTDLGYALLMMVVVIAALERLGVKTTAAVAVLGAMGLAVGFAMQGSLGNFASGVMLILFKPYKVGDLVTVAGKTGVVDGIKVFNTELVTPDNRQIMIPNGAITSGTIENLTARGTLRIDLEIGIGYNDDIKKAKEVLEQVLSSDDRILAEPAAQVAVCALADSSVNFVVRPWVKASDYWDVRFDTLERVKNSLDDAGISIPYPQQDVHMHEVAKAA
jgi:small conductance mechanosensitive channel